jgi:hypothetical protein
LVFTFGPVSRFVAAISIEGIGTSRFWKGFRWDIEDGDNLFGWTLCPKMYPALLHCIVCGDASAD